MDRLPATISLILWGGHTNLLGQSILTDPHGFEELFQQKLTGSDSFEQVHDSYTSMIIRDFNLFGTSLRPDKAYARLPIYRNT